MDPGNLAMVFLSYANCGIPQHLVGTSAGHLKVGCSPIETPLRAKVGACYWCLECQHRSHQCAFMVDVQMVKSWQEFQKPKTQDGDTLIFHLHWCSLPAWGSHDNGRQHWKKVQRKSSALWASTGLILSCRSTILSSILESLEFSTLFLAIPAARLAWDGIITWSPHPSSRHSNQEEKIFIWVLLYVRSSHV